MRCWNPLKASLLSLLIALGACQPQPKQPQTAQAPPSLEKKHAHADVYKIVSEQSSIKLKVYRDGPLARFGHNHVIAIEQISGTVFREKLAAQSEVELSFPVAAMIVDRPLDRAEAGNDFAATVTPEAVAGTRENMLGPKLLAAQQYPQLELRSVAISGAWPDLQIVMAIKLREFESQIVLPVHINELDGMLSVDGGTRLSQVQLGLTPYSVLGGGLRVSDAIDAQFHIVAQRQQK